MKRYLVIGIAAVALSGCATAPHESWLPIAEARCQADPSQPECTTLLPQLRAIVAQERADAAAQNAATAAAIGLGILSLGAAALDDSCCYYHPYYHHWRH